MSPITRIPVKWGIILGVAIGAWTMLLHALGYYTVDLQRGQYADIAAIVMPVVVIFLAIRERRRRNDRGHLTVRQGVTTGVATGLVSVPLSAGFLWVYHNFINPRWLEYLEAFERQRLASAGATASDISQKVAAVHAGGSDAAQLTGALVGTLILSAILSLIFSLILRRTASA